MAGSTGSSPGVRKASGLARGSLASAVFLSGCMAASTGRWSEPRGTRPAAAPTASTPGGEPSDWMHAEARSGSRILLSGEPIKADRGVARSSAETAFTVPPEIAAPSVPPSREYPIDLTTSLRLTEAENPLIAVARQQIGEALAVQQGARALLLPSINAGMNYHSHSGDLQRSSGRILSLNEKSLYFGGGAGVLAAGTAEVPAITIYSALTDAIFEPLAAKQLVEGAEFNATATANTILREVAELYFDLLAAEADLRVRQLSAAQEAELARLTRAYADAKQGREADAERAETELRLVEIEVRQAEEDVAVASARLAHRLHLDQSVRVRPAAPDTEIVTLIDPSSPLPGLIQTALSRRPELGARAAVLVAAEIRHKQERYRPLLPTLLVGFSAGGFGGGSNLVGPELAHFGGRTDFDVMAYWTLRNLGVGNLSLQKRRLAEVGIAVGEQSRMIAEVRTEVSAAYADVIASRQQVDITTRELASAEIGFREDLQRIRNTVGRPLEAVNSLQLLNRARVARIRAVTEYNKAQFRLFVSLGSPPPLGPSASGPIPPAPIASPPLPPLARLNQHGNP